MNKYVCLLSYLLSECGVKHINTDHECIICETPNDFALEFLVMGIAKMDSNLTLCHEKSESKNSMYIEVSQ